MLNEQRMRLVCFEDEAILSAMNLLSGVDFWARKRVKTAALMLRRRAVSPRRLSGNVTTHFPEFCTSGYILRG